MKGKIKDIIITTMTVILAIFLTFFTQSLLPMLYFLTVGNSLVRWGYFLFFYLTYFYAVSKIIFLIGIKRGHNEV